MKSRDLTRIPPEIAVWGQKVLPQANSYRVIGDHLGDILRDEQFAQMYESTGRKAVSPSLLAMVTIFQFQESLPDREATQMVLTRLDWKYALHLSLDYPGFHYSDLCYFRQRLLEHHRDALVFEAILAKVKELGFIKKRGKQRTDSLAVIGAVRQLSRLELVTETLRLVVRALEGADRVWAEEVLPASFRERYARTKPDYQLTEEERKAALQEAGQDGFWLLDRLEVSASEAVGSLEGVGTLRVVWKQQYERVDGEARLREGGVDCKDLIVSPHDVGVRAGEKRGKKWIGEKVHITETAEEGGPNFITDITTVGASEGDVEALPEIRQHLEERGVMPGEQYVDAGYVSGKQLADSEAEGVELMGPPLADTSKNEFKIADFEIDWVNERAICPAGQTSAVWGRRKQPDGSKAVYVRFRAASCGACEMRGRCTRSKEGRTLQISEHYDLVASRRAEAQTEEFKEKMRARPAVEGTLSELVRKHGMRRHRYRGEAKRPLENLFKGAACNLKRLVRAMVEGWSKPKVCEMVVASHG